MADIDVDINSLSRSDLSKFVSKYTSMANKRLRLLEPHKTGSLKQIGFTPDYSDSPAYRKAMKTGGYFSVAGKDKRELQKELSRTLEFLNMSTSKVSNFKRYKKRVEAFSAESGQRNAEREDKIWGTISKLMETGSFKKIAAEMKNAASDLIDEVFERVTKNGQSADDILSSMMIKLDTKASEMDTIDFNDLL